MFTANELVFAYTVLVNELVFTYTVLKLVFLINLLGLGVAIDLDTQVVPILLPVHLAVSDIEEIFDTQFLATRHLDESDSSWYVLLFRHPVGYDVVRGRPGKVPVGRKWPFIHNQSNTILYTS